MQLYWTRPAYAPANGIGCPRIERPVIRTEEVFLDTALYDDRMAPPVAVGTLLTAVRQLRNERSI
jgi:hypothetical protein